MGMSIDDSITELEILKKNTFSYMSAHQAFITAIDTMRKYQKIEQVIKDWESDRGWALEMSELYWLDRVKEVIEDGKVD